MASALSLSALLIAAMFCGIDESITGSIPIEDLKARCQTNSTAIFADPGECQLYYNCSNDAVTTDYRNPLTQYMEECPYPQLFSPLTSRCMDFDDVTCDARAEPLDCDEYHYLQCFRCSPCYVFHPSCRGLADGLNVYEWREWSPNYALCRSQRPVLTGYCPQHNSLKMTQFLHPEKKRCVSLYEVPHKKVGMPWTMNCTGKADGLHLDDVTNRPDVYYQCHKGEVVEVEKCGGGTYFDELLLFCVEGRPLKNRIMDADN